MYVYIWLYNLACIVFSPGLLSIDLPRAVDSFKLKSPSARRVMGFAPFNQRRHCRYRSEISICAIILLYLRRKSFVKGNYKRILNNTFQIMFVLL